MNNKGIIATFEHVVTALLFIYCILKLRVSSDEKLSEMDLRVLEDLKEAHYEQIQTLLRANLTRVYDRFIPTGLIISVIASNMLTKIKLGLESDSTQPHDWMTLALCLSSHMHGLDSRTKSLINNPRQLENTVEAIDASLRNILDDVSIIRDHWEFARDSYGIPTE